MKKKNPICLLSVSYVTFKEKEIPIFLKQNLFFPHTKGFANPSWVSYDLTQFYLE